MLHKASVLNFCTTTNFAISDLMPSVNDFMVILIIPMLDYLIYPHLEKTMGYKVQSLHKVTNNLASIPCWSIDRSSNVISSVSPLPAVGWWYGSSCLVVPDVWPSPALPPGRVV